MLLYALHHLIGYADMPIEELQRFRQLGSRTAGHPEYGHALGIETTTGPLGQGIANAVGMALAERMLAARYGDELVDHYTYVIAGDGCLMEGISHEAIDLAGHLRLDRLIVFWDDNAISIDGPTSLSTSMDQPARFAAAGWHVQRGRRPRRGSRRRGDRRGARQPTGRSLIACRTIIGKGAPNCSGSEKTHGAPLGEAEIAADRAKHRLAARAVRGAGRDPSRPGATSPRAARRRARAWEKRLAASPQRAAFEAAIAGDAAGGRVRAHWAPSASEHVDKATKVATRKASEMALGVINARDRPHDRRLGRPHAFEPDADRRAWAASRPATSPAATSTTASASTAWRRR